MRNRRPRNRKHQISPTMSRLSRRLSRRDGTGEYPVRYQSADIELAASTEEPDAEPHFLQKTGRHPVLRNNQQPAHAQSEKARPSQTSARALLCPRPFLTPRPMFGSLPCVDVFSCKKRRRVEVRGRTGIICFGRSDDPICNAGNILIILIIRPRGRMRSLS